MNGVEGLNAGSSAGPIAAPQTAAAGKDQFLKLLVAQISHQDPMNPLDDKDLVTQLAQFSSIEQAIETNQRLAALQGATATQGRTALAGLIGREVSADARTLHWRSDGQAPRVGFELQGAAQKVDVQITDANGRLVRTLHLGAMSPGAQSIPWDGRSDSNTIMPDGDYDVTLQAADANGKPVQALTQTRGVVTGVGFDAGGAAIMLGDIRLRPQDIQEINSLPASPAPAVAR